MPFWLKPFWLKPFWLKPFLLKLKQMLRWLFFLCVLLHFVMPRRWHQTPNGWWQKSIRGPRPPSVSWPRAPSDPSVWARPVRIYEAGRPRSSFARSHYPPEVTTADAMAEVQRLESAIAVLGESNPHAGPLLKSLQVAKSRSRAPPVAGRIEACKSFIERAKRRVVRAEEVIQRAQDQKDVCVAEVAAAEGW